MTIHTDLVKAYFSYEWKSDLNKYSHPGGTVLYSTSLEVICVYCSTCNMQILYVYLFYYNNFTKCQLSLNGCFGFIERETYPDKFVMAGRGEFVHLFGVVLEQLSLFTICIGQSSQFSSRVSVGKIYLKCQLFLTDIFVLYIMVMVHKFEYF